MIIIKEISNTLTDAIFTVCNKVIKSAKFDKTYKCRVINKIDNKRYLVEKNDIEHVVTSTFEYHPDDIVTVLLPENSWKNATIVYPQNTTVDLSNYVTQGNFNGIMSNMPIYNSRVILSSIGWYRIAVYNASSPTEAKGAIANSVDIVLKKTFNYGGTEYIKATLNSAYTSSFFSLYDKYSMSAGDIFKIRHTVDEINMKSYIEIYYTSDKANHLEITLSNNITGGNKWIVMTPEKTEEIVDGIAIYSLLDIRNTIPISASSANKVLNIYNGTVSGDTKNTLVENWDKVPTGVSICELKQGSITYALVGKVSDLYGVALIISYSHSSPFYGTLVNKIWTWRTFNMVSA